MTIERNADPREVVYEYTPCFPEILEQLRTSILISTFQAGKVIVLATSHGKLQVAFHDFDRPMGLAVHENQLAVGCREAIETFERQQNCPGIGRDVNSESSTYQRRRVVPTGNVLGHDLAWCDDELWLVSTLFSSLCAMHDNSFDVRWKPEFITKLKAEDRCHLNGLALAEGCPRCVTAFGQTDEPTGWRANKASGGCLIDIDNDAIIVEGLSMPHSPRHHGNRLWLLNSGVGAFGCVDLRRGKFESVEMLPGYTRGLAFAEHYAFVGLSKIRETSTFDGVPIASNPAELHCGVGIVDLLSGTTVAVFQFHTGVSEIFAVETITGLTEVRFATGNTTAK
jgi:uncharacterized protein (TIGR03032 family)